MFVDFPKNDPPGHEQEGQRPAIILGMSDYQYPMFRVVPLTTVYDVNSERERTLAKRFPEVFPVFPKGVGGLERDSIVLSNQSRWLDRSRIIDHYGTLTVAEYAVVVAGLRAANKNSG